MKFQQRHIRGPVIVGAFVLLVSAGVIGGYLSLRDYPKPGDIVDIVNLDGDSAVFIRSVSGPDDRSFISLFDRDGGERWGAMIPSYRPRSPVRADLAATGDAVFVRTNASGQWAFFAFDGQRGHKLGRIEPFETRTTGPGEGLERVASLSDAGQAFEFGGTDSNWAVILAFDLRTGTLIWQSELGVITIHRAWLRERHILLVLNDGLLGKKLRVYDRQTGDEVQQFLLVGEPCVTADTLYYSRNLHDEDRQPVFARSLRAEDEAVPGALGEAQRLTENTIKLQGLCGERAGRVILAGSDADGPALFALDTRPLPDDPPRKQSDGQPDEQPESSDDPPDQGTDATADTPTQDQPEARPEEPNLRWRIPVPGTWYIDDVALLTPDRVPFSGELAAFVPVLVDGHLLMIDIDAGRVAWRVDPGPATDSARLLLADGESYLYNFVGDTLVAFDGQTGQVRAARSVPGYNRVWPRNIAGGTVWLARKRDWVVLDARTLAPLESSGTGEVGDDIRADVAGQLGSQTTRPETGP